MRLTQIVLNLLDNAVKYNRPVGTVTLALADQGHVVRLSIHDTGPGLNAEQQALLFQAFVPGV